MQGSTPPTVRSHTPPSISGIDVSELLFALPSSTEGVSHAIRVRLPGRQPTPDEAVEEGPRTPQQDGPTPFTWAVSRKDSKAKMEYKSHKMKSRGKLSETSFLLQQVLGERPEPPAPLVGPPVPEEWEEELEAAAAADAARLQTARAELELAGQGGSIDDEPAQYESNDDRESEDYEDSDSESESWVEMTEQIERNGIAFLTPQQPIDMLADVSVEWEMTSISDSNNQTSSFDTDFSSFVPEADSSWDIPCTRLLHKRESSSAGADSEARKKHKQDTSSSDNSTFNVPPRRQASFGATFSFLRNQVPKEASPRATEHVGGGSTPPSPNTVLSSSPFQAPEDLISPTFEDYEPQWWRPGLARLLNRWEKTISAATGKLPPRAMPYAKQAVCTGITFSSVDQRNESLDPVPNVNIRLDFESVRRITVFEVHTHSSLEQIEKGTYPFQSLKPEAGLWTVIRIDEKEEDSDLDVTSTSRVNARLRKDGLRNGSPVSSAWQIIAFPSEMITSRRVWTSSEKPSQLTTSKTYRPSPGLLSGGAIPFWLPNLAPSPRNKGRPSSYPGPKAAGPMPTKCFDKRPAASSGYTPRSHPELTEKGELVPCFVTSSPASSSKILRSLPKPAYKGKMVSRFLQWEFAMLGRLPLMDGEGVDPGFWDSWITAVGMGCGRIVIEQQTLSGIGSKKVVDGAWKGRKGRRKGNMC
ncbi:hypothetical protein P152DRAFT_482303 [Eremomyces bilateralis CBS 781.70]|uniref:Uncharacterized protein n=1 Tax=Eremomyces bilateralis CBS 781.70 TaxID=1392243 RepID=A0A6G1G382_9PEZI|nr:uncharacterized protein P152DRAFT_482303 [Eremomyces bilateralis CBS 781.70]KAF1812269.1 hypothetical protein P152DRAFT_482303 [Eremomyces bilateralis CBS 781.70]